MHNNDNIVFDCPVDPIINIENIIKTLPNWKTKIKDVRIINKENESLQDYETPIYQVRFIIAATNTLQIKNWLKDLEEISSASYSIKSTTKCDGRYVDFKQRLYCHHKTKCNRLYDSSLRNRTRNTNCPSKIIITLRSVKAIYQGKNKQNAPNPEMPCEILFICTHNHDLKSVDTLRFRIPSESVKTKLIELFECGHTPASALDTLKIEIQLNYENYEEKLNDRKHFPDYMYTYHLFISELKKKYGPTEFESMKKEFLKNRKPKSNHTSCTTENSSFTDELNESISDEDINENDKIEWDENAYEEFLLRGKEVIEEISNKLNNFFQNSPYEVLQGLEKLNSKLDQIETSEFISSCTTFGSSE